MALSALPAVRQTKSNQRNQKNSSLWVKKPNSSQFVEFSLSDYQGALCMQEGLHFKKLHATSTASYGCMNRLKYCCGIWWLRKEFIVWHVPMPNVSLTYHSIHVRQRESMTWHFAQFLILLPTWCNRQTVYNNYIYECQWSYNLHFFNIYDHAYIIVHSLFFCQQLSPISWTFHTCQAPGQNENNDRVVQGIVVVRDPLVLRVTLWWTLYIPSRDTRNTPTCTCTVVAYCTIIAETLR